MSRPNIILILADDMGFADLGCTGSEIRTPNIDALAKGGTLLSAMYNCARCCPTRASLLTGLYPHNAGIGHMGANLGTPAYQGFLRNDSATIAEHLRAAGYRTLMSGKWHVAGDFESRDYDSWRPGDIEHPTPRQRGFDRFFGIMDGATHFFSPHYMMEDDSRVEVLPDDFYFTDAITDKAITMIQDSVTDETPFFLYLAHTAPHWPLHAHPEDIARYDEIYAKGWDAIRTARHETMNGMGLFQTQWDISPRDPDVHRWSEETHTDWEAAKMATYAAMVDRMDQSIGTLVGALRKLGQLDNTLILFLSDNGGCAEFMAEDGWAQFYPDVTQDGRKITMGNVPNLTPGDAQTFQSYDKPWANVSNAPFRLFKHYVHEGGISTPLVAHWPNGFEPQTVRHAPCHVVDILPTILEATGAPYLQELGGHDIQPTQGESLLSLLRGSEWDREQPIFFEHEGNAAIRLGQFKLVRLHGQDWELYDMEADRTELHNLIHGEADRAKAMRRSYQNWADMAGVMDWDVALPKLLKAWNMDSADG
ncbi:arylsulfatase [Falsiruegeria mediterranea]|uniref:Arylsulfatase n=1 Tax=Falsiruegeria mediterranea M17 TaxID=1200281 RepID=A0A2R8C2A9_9RHOB|nr:arylsulfatase [Falsiruegeria mediterranea]SPJ26572.1 Arylsulfatase [Falsiruegeria mediterranea M17]